MATSTPLRSAAAHGNPGFVMRFGHLATSLPVLACVACATCAPVAAAQQDGLSTPPVTVEHPVVFEAPFKLGNRPTLRSQTDAKAEEEALARWNVGGRGGTWHPHARVIVDGVPVKGKGESPTVLRTARAKSYWHIRQCYDPALSNNPELRGKITVQFSIRNTGTAVRPTLVGRPTLNDEAVVACIRRSIRKIKFPRSPRGIARVRLDITLSPGDAPIKVKEEPPVTAGPGSVSLPTVQALVAGHAGAQIQQCYVDGVRRVPGLWGRLVLRADVAPNGSIRQLVEIDSTFPDQQTTDCTIKSIRGIGLPPPQGGDMRIVLPIRFGQPR